MGYCWCGVNTVEFLKTIVHEGVEEHKCQYLHDWPGCGRTQVIYIPGPSSERHGLAYALLRALL